MNDYKKLIVIIIRIQALGFILSAVIVWFTIAVQFVIASLKTVPSQLSNYEGLLTTGIGYLIVGLILYARSKSLANYFISGLQDDKDSTSQN